MTGASDKLTNREKLIYRTTTGIVCAVMVFSIINFIFNDHFPFPNGPEGAFVHQTQCLVYHRPIVFSRLVDRVLRLFRKEPFLLSNTSGVISNSNLSTALSGAGDFGRWRHGRRLQGRGHQTRTPHCPNALACNGPTWIMRTSGQSNSSSSQGVSRRILASAELPAPISVLYLSTSNNETDQSG